MACGTPVVVNAEGGARETLADRPVGALADPESTASLRAAVEVASRCPRASVAEHARRFDAPVFDRALTTAVTGAVRGP
jgi:glycosyltransferase involved in cell wall biosynthesis